MHSGRSLKLLPLLLVVVAALASCVQLYEHHRTHYRERWVGVGHDRNAHYRYGLLMAADLKTGNLPRFFKDFDAGSWMWPPLNSVGVAAVTLATGPSPVTAVLPALLGYFLAAVFAFLVIQRVMEGWPGIFAGWLAAALVLLSPAHKAFATDVMLESLGAGLTLVVLHAFLVWSQVRTVASARWLGIALMLSFLEKYNYWLLALMAMVPVHLWEQRREYLALLGRLKREVPWRAWLLGQFRRPLNYPIAVLIAMLVAHRVTGGFTLEAFGKKLDVNNNQLLVTLAYGLTLLRIAAWWWIGARSTPSLLEGEGGRSGRAIAREWLPTHVYPLIDWFILPALTWLAIPPRIRNFVWFLSPTNTTSDYRPTFLEGLQYYWNAACNQYAPSPDVMPAIAIPALMSLLLIFVPRFYRAGGWVVPAFALLSMLSTVRHPNHQERFLHTGMAGVYVAAGVGLFGLLILVPMRVRSFAAGVAFALALAGLLAQAGPNLGGPGHAAALNVPPGGVSLRRATDAVQPLLNEGEPSAVFSNVPSKFWAMWLYLERFPRPDLLQPDCRDVGVLDAPTAPQFAEWCKATRTKRVVFIDVAKDSPLYEDNPTEASSRTILGFLPDSPFRQVQSLPVEGVGTITVWVRE
jgi:hypothetical protein